MDEAIAPAAHLCEPWCARHDDAGGEEQWCLAETRIIEPALAAPGGLVAVTVEQHPALSTTVHLNVDTADGADLLPHEARAVARLLLAAADIADGVSAQW